MVYVDPLPSMLPDPGDIVNVHIPVAGNPVRLTLAVANTQVGCVIVPITGAVGTDGCGFITTSAEAMDVQLSTLVTVKVCVPTASPVSVVVVVDPVIPPGLIVHAPAGNPLNTTLPVVVKHVGCVIAPITGAVGVAGCAFITTFPVAADVHPDNSPSSVTVKV
jgi:hypothetical protein